MRVRRRDFQSALAALAIGVPAALSLLPYRPIIREAQDWSVLSQIGFVPALIASSLSDAVAPTLPWTRWLWIGLAVGAVAACVKSFHVLPNARGDADNARAAFAGSALLAGLISFFFFLWVAKMPTQIWYFLPLTTFAAVCIDAALASWPRWPFWRLAVPALALACLPAALRAQLDAYDKAADKQAAENPLMKEIIESQKKFAERAVKWDLDNNVQRAMAYNHYFGKQAGGAESKKG